MTALILSWLMLALSVWLAAALLPGFEVKGAGGALVTAGVFGLLSWLIGGLLYVVIGVGTLGLGFLLSFLTRWVVNALLLKLTDAMTSRVRVAGFGTALLAALLMSLFASVGETVLRSLGLG